MDEVEVGGLRIAFRQMGEGPPLVLLHGGLGDSREWRMQLNGLADKFMVVAWDAPGCGQSSDPPVPFRLADYADCLSAFIHTLGLDHPHVLGLSFGAGLALELYRRHPTLPQTLVLASAYAGWAGSLPAEEVAQRLDAALRLADMPPEQWAPDFISELLTDAASPELREELVAMMLDVRSVGIQIMARAFAEADLRDVLPVIRVPTLLLYGDADVRSPLHIARELHDKIPGASLVVMPGVGHQSNIEDAHRFNTEVRGFLRVHQA